MSVEKTREEHLKKKEREEEKRSERREEQRREKIFCFFFGLSGGKYQRNLCSN